MQRLAGRGRLRNNCGPIGPERIARGDSIRSGRIAIFEHLHQHRLIVRAAQDRLAAAERGRGLILREYVVAGWVAAW